MYSGFSAFFWYAEVQAYEILIRKYAKQSVFGHADGKSDWRILHGRKKISATYSLGGTGWKQMQTGGTVIMSLVVPIFL